MVIHEQKVQMFDDLMHLAQCWSSPAELRQLEQAYLLADRAHSGALRASGEPYITHPWAVAIILAQAGHDATTLVAALLHDVPEDTSISLQEIKECFGPEVAELVNGVTVPKAASANSGVLPRSTPASPILLTGDDQSGVLKLQHAIKVEPRVALVKLADVLHNLRTLHHLPVSRRRRFAHQALRLYLPLARSFMPQIVDELVLLSCRNLRKQA